MDNYDISIETIDSINNPEILREEYKHTLRRMLNLEKFITEKLVLLFISSIFSVIAYFIIKTLEEFKTIYLDFMMYGLIGIIGCFTFIFFFAYITNRKLKKRKIKLIELLKHNKYERL